MTDQLKKQLIEALKDQKEIFGDYLFEEVTSQRKSDVDMKKKSTNVDEPDLFPSEKEEWEKTLLAIPKKKITFFYRMDSE